MTQRKSPVIKHLHLYNPPNPPPKPSPFTKIGKAMKVLGRFFSRWKVRKESERDRMDTRTSEESHWPSDIEESVFASENEDDLEA